MLAASTASAQEATSFRYDLRPGDHLVYDEAVERKVESPQVQQHVRLTFTNHVLVMGERQGQMSVAVQRNRTSADLLSYKEGGKDRTDHERSKFNERLAKQPSAYVDANELDAAGSARLPWNIVRESLSKLLPLAHEVTEISPQPRKGGEEWTSAALPGFSLKLVGTETLRGETCARVEAEAPNRVTNRIWFCPSMGLAARVEMEGSYSAPGGARVRDSIRFELRDQRRGEKTHAWLADASTQQGALMAMLASDWLPARLQYVEPALRSAPAEAQALALALLYRRQVSPPTDVLSALAASENPEVKRIASRFTEQPGNATPICGSSGQSYVQRLKPGTYLRTMKGEFADRAYIVRVPIEYGRATVPTMLYLSGGGGFAIDAALATGPDASRAGYLIVYPEAREWWWRDGPTKVVHALIDDVLRDYNVDTNRFYVTGFSNGAGGALLYAGLWPQRFAAAAFLMGAGVLTPDFPEGIASNLKDVPVLVVHGDKDEVIPVAAAERTADAIRGLDPETKPEVHILKGRQHDITLATDDGLTIPFLERHRRNAFPKHIEFSALGRFPARHFWAELLEGGRKARIEGRILPNRRIELKTRDVRRLRLLLRPELVDSAETVQIVANGKDMQVAPVSHDCSLIEQTGREAGDPWLGYSTLIELNLE